MKNTEKYLILKILIEDEEDFTKEDEKLRTFNEDIKCQLILKIYCNIRPTYKFR